MGTREQNCIVTNLSGQPRMLDILRAALSSANEFAMSVSFFKCSGVGLLIDDLKRFTQRGGRGRILTSTYLGITQAEALRAVQKIPGIEARLHLGGFLPNPTRAPITGFHTKLYVFRGQTATCWIGSSNLTKGGLSTNVEANLFHEEVQTVAAAEETFNLLWSREDVRLIDSDLLTTYENFVRRAQDIRSFNNYGTGLDATAPTDETEKVQPNEAQVEALGRLWGLRESGEARAAIIAAPGVGKTFLAAFDVQQANAQTVLFLSHRLEHLGQAQRTFQRVFGTSRTYGRVFQGYSETAADFVFATVQSANGNDALTERDFDYVVIDEFHHADAPSYRPLIQRGAPKFMLGLTATPERQDGHDVLRLCDYNVAYEVRLVEAIRRNWLRPFHYFGVSDSTVDYSAIPWRSGKFDYAKLENALMLQERVDEIVRHALEKGYDGSRRASVCFCAGIRHAKFMAESLTARGYSAVAITSETASLDEREAIYRRFQDPDDPLEWLCVADVLNEGVDIPGINSILFLRPTESPTIFIQQLGRGLRLTPDSEVLTVIDFVGHHRAAWLPLSALHDADAGRTSSSITELDFTPPKNCEVILDDRTREILIKVRQQSETKKELCLAAYDKLAEECGRPYPIDLWGRKDMPEFAEFRASFGSWIRLRQAAGDSEPWEDQLAETELAYQFLAALERDWQQSRIYPYALVWGLAKHPNLPPEDGYGEFFKAHPKWQVEYKALADTDAFSSLSKKLGACLVDRKLASAIRSMIPDNVFNDEVEGRLRLTLESDFKLRHGGILRTPKDLVLHRRYDRPEILNHFGVQYDPARHNFGIIDIGNHLVIITKLDTSGAIKNHQYINRFRDAVTFAWQSQNRQRQNNVAGRAILDHRTNGKSLHLFVQPRSHEKAYYCGRVAVEAVSGNAPMNVTFNLDIPLSAGVSCDLIQVDAEQPGRSGAPEAVRPAGGHSSPARDGTNTGNIVALPMPGVGKSDEIYLPFYSVAAAAGGFLAGDAMEPEGWINCSAHGFKATRTEGMFVTRVVGRSMEPTIPNGAFCIFRRSVVGSRQGRVLLVQQHDISDPETGGSYTVKRYRSAKVEDGDSWQHSAIELLPDNPDFPPIRFRSDEDVDLRVVGELVLVLGVGVKVEALPS